MATRNEANDAWATRLANGLAATCVFALCATSSAALAQEELPPTVDEVPDDGFRARENTYETARGLGMGAGARASAVGTSAIAYNAANLPMARMYHAETFAGYFPTASTWNFGGSVVDSVSNKIAAGLSFHGVYGGGDRNYSGYDGRLALGMPLSRAIAVGVTGRYIRLNSRSENENGDRIGPSLKAFTIDASIRLTPTEGLHIALLGYNLIRTDSPIAPMQLGGSVSYAIGGVFTLAGDVLVDLTTFDSAEMIFGVGAEYLIAGQVPVRAGYRRDNGREINQITAAIGYVDQKIGIDAAIRQDIGNENRETQLVFSFRYHVQ